MTFQKILKKYLVLNVKCGTRNKNINTTVITELSRF